MLKMGEDSLDRKFYQPITRQDVLNVQKFSNLDIIPEGSSSMAKNFQFSVKSEEHQKQIQQISHQQLQQHSATKNKQPQSVPYVESQKLLKEVCKDILSQTIYNDTVAAEALEKALELQKVYINATSMGYVKIDHEPSQRRRTFEKVFNFFIFFRRNFQKFY